MQFYLHFQDAPIYIISLPMRNKSNFDNITWLVCVSMTNERAETGNPTGRQRKPMPGLHPI